MNIALLRIIALYSLMAFLPATAHADTASPAMSETDVAGLLTQVEMAISVGRLTQAESMLNGMKHSLPEGLSERHALLSAELHMASGDVAAANREIAALSPETAEPCRYGGIMGWLAYQTGDWNRAISMLAKSVDACPDDAGRWNLLGLALVRKQEMPAALEAFDQALILAPAHPALLNNRALAYAYSGKSGTALSDLEKAAAIAPDNSGIIANLAVMRANSGLDAPLANGQDPQMQALILEKAGEGASAAARYDSARSYFAEALLRSERFDPSLWARATQEHPEKQQELMNARGD